ncbi:MAG: CRISPR-associated endonuclease Cas2 [Coriobacteriia bacterium]|jgi:CRISPR-associated protein Cas2|nr:CRISPR-associated endonuclease Cas2 [Coriobacteriia bacterium]
MRRAYIVSYDICNPRRLRKVYKTMRGYGRHLQLSVFACELSDMERATMVDDLGKIIHHTEDQVLTIDLGPLPGPFAERITSLGLPYVPRERRAVVV